MKIYLVGGAVRDKLLGLQIKERDWVVVGGTEKDMLKAGFKKVGKDFPVFLHPVTNEEYALARTEKKIGKGYLQFSCFASPNITLEEDLKRRDLTINAIAEDTDGNIFDPYNGCKDIKNKLLRHVSNAFSEDPVRILRTARFASRYGNFIVHPKTNKLMKIMLSNGEVDALVPERVWNELEKALKESYPEKFFVVLKNCNVLEKLFPEINLNLQMIKKNTKKLVSTTNDAVIRFASIMFYCNREGIINFCKKYKVPNRYLDLALLTNSLKDKIKISTDYNEEVLIKILESTDAYRRPLRLESALTACIINEKQFIIISKILMKAYQITKDVKLTPKIINDMKNKENIKLILHECRKNKLCDELKKINY